MKIPNSLKATFGILISLFFLWLVFRKVNFIEVLSHLKQLKIQWLLVFVIITLFNYFLKGFRWSALSIDKYKNIALFVRSFTTGMMLNNILPLRMGDVVRAYLISIKLNIKKSSMIGTVVIERLFDVLSLLILLSIFILVVKEIEIPGVLKHLSRIGIIFGLASFIFLIFFNRSKERILQKLDSLHNVKLLKKLTGLIDSLMEGFSVLNHNHHIIGIISLSILIWLTEAVSFLFVGLAFGMTPNIFTFIFVMISVCLSTLIPSGPGYLGVFEGACVGALILFGIDKEIALAYAVVVHALQIILITITGILCAAKEGWNLKELEKIGTNK